MKAARMNAGWKLAGLCCYYADKLADRLLHRELAPTQRPVADRTGRVLKNHSQSAVCTRWGDVFFLGYPGLLAHSLWRSQEVTLFWRHAELLRPPRLDFGCGDGSFSAALFDHVDWGVDRDDVALQTASRLGIYRNLLCCDATRLPLPAGSVGSVFANSVLEHVDQPEAVLRELHRALAPGGILMLTVPVSPFAEHLARYFGRQESDRINRVFVHKNLHPVLWWEEFVNRIGFEILWSETYQPEWFTFAYRVCTTRFFSVLQRSSSLTTLMQRMGVRMVRRSLEDAGPGGNLLLIAARRASPVIPSAVAGRC